MSFSKNVVLRPRFQIELSQSKKKLITAFKESNCANDTYVISIIDDHIFIRFPKAKQHFWSPQLQLEIRPNKTTGVILHGLIGPSPSVWTLFMFFHFMIAILFIGSSFWAYSNYVLKQTYAPQLFIMFALVGIWFTFYFVGRMGKKTAQKETNQLYSFLTSILQLP